MKQRVIIAALFLIGLYVVGGVPSSLFAQSATAGGIANTWRAVVSEAATAVNAPPSRLQPQVPNRPAAMYGGYSTTQPASSAVSARTPATAPPLSPLPSSEETEQRSASSNKSAAQPIVQAQHVEPVASSPRQVMPAYRMPSLPSPQSPSQPSPSSPSVIGRPVPSPQLTASWEAVPKTGGNVVPTTGTTVTPVVPSSSTAASSPSLWRRITDDFRPSNDRRWQQNFAMMPRVEFHGHQVTVRNIRYTLYRTREDYTTRYYDATYRLDELQTLDFIIAPFPRMQSVAHVEVSFGFADGRYLALSIEPRFEEGERDDPVGSVANQFELTYLLADERDVVRLYTQVGRGDVYLYRLNLTPEEVRKVFESVALRVNTLADKPEFYHGVTNNCATNLFAHINYARPGAIPRDYRSRFPGLVDNLMFQRQMFVTSAKTLSEAQDSAKINWLAEEYGDLDYFSAGIRQNLF